MNYFATLPHFLAYFGSVVVLAILFLIVYTHVTPHREFRLIRDGNTAVAVQLVGTFLGFALPLASVVGHSVNIVDVFLWGAVALVTQIVVFMVLIRVFKDIEKRLVDNCVGSGILVGGISLGIGILQASCQIPG